MTDKLSDKLDELTTVNIRLAALINLSQDLALESEPLKILEGLCSASREIIGASFSAVSINVPDVPGPAIFFTSGADPETPQDLALRLARQESLASLGLDRRTMRIAAPQPEGAPPVLSCLGAAIVSLKHCYGWLYIAGKLGGREFSEEDERIAAMLAGQVGRIYETRRLLVELSSRTASLQQEVVGHRRARAQLSQQAARLKSLHRIDKAILSHGLPADIAQAALRRIHELSNHDLAAAFLLDAGTAHLIAKHVAGDVIFPSRHWSRDDFPGEQICLERPFLYIDDLSMNETDFTFAQALRDVGMRSLAIKALVAEGRLLGVLALAARRPHAFTLVQRRTLREVAHLLAIAIQTARLRLDLQRNLENLEQQIGERERAENEVRRLNGELEQRVKQRTTQLEAANRELETFSYSVSHDLRAPLRAITSFAKALAEDFGQQMPAKAQSYLSRVLASSARMGGLIDDLLSLARVSRGQLNAQTVDIALMARELVAAFRESNPNRDVEFVCAPQLIVRGDLRLLRVALENLLNNAWKYTSKRARARIELGRTESAADAVVFFVRDNGAGFDMQSAARLFGAFQRLHSNAEFPGSGVGLATVKRIIHRHGGHVWAEAAVNRGATFYFSLPREAIAPVDLGPTLSEKIPAA